jgi:hypothetical protein
MTFLTQLVAADRQRELVAAARRAAPPAPVRARRRLRRRPARLVAPVRCPTC